MSGHTPEPWIGTDRTSIYLALDDASEMPIAVIADEKMPGETIWIAYVPMQTALDQANLDRIVHCVNACADLNIGVMGENTLRPLLEMAQGPLITTMRHAADQARLFSLNAPENDFHTNYWLHKAAQIENAVNLINALLK
jgi:hypothetical protein